MQYLKPLCHLAYSFLYICVIQTEALLILLLITIPVPVAEVSNY